MLYDSILGLEIDLKNKPKINLENLLSKQV